MKQASEYRNLLVAEFSDSSKTNGLLISNDQITQLSTYLALLDSWNSIHNFTGFAPSEWISRIVLESIALIRFFPQKQHPLTICDFGSGAGIPGLILGILRSSDRCFLIESRLKRADFLGKVVIECALQNVQVVAKRVENEMRDRELIRNPIDIVVARAFGSLEEIVRLGSVMLAPTGCFILPRGREIQKEISRFKSFDTHKWQIESHTYQVAGISDDRFCVVIQRNTVNKSTRR